MTIDGEPVVEIDRASQCTARPATLACRRGRMRVNVNEGDAADGVAARLRPVMSPIDAVV
jgi:hypothetical protein